MPDLRAVSAALVVFAAIVNTGVSYAADKIFLVCSGTSTVHWEKISTGPYGPASLVIDLDGGIVTWGDVSIPIVKTQGTFVEFGTKEIAKALDSHSYTGTMDRVTGGVSIMERWVRESWDSDVTQPKPWPLRTEEFTYDLTCKRTNPVF
jgi:hypothetical protein